MDKTASAKTLISSLVKGIHNWSIKHLPTVTEPTVRIAQALGTTSFNAVKKHPYITAGTAGALGLVSITKGRLGTPDLPTTGDPNDPNNPVRVVAPDPMASDAELHVFEDDSNMVYGAGIGGATGAILGALVQGFRHKNLQDAALGGLMGGSAGLVGGALVGSNWRNLAKYYRR